MFEQISHGFTHRRYTGRAADEDDALDVFGHDICVIQNLLGNRGCARHQLGDHGFEIRTGNFVAGFCTIQVHNHLDRIKIGQAFFDFAGNFQQALGVRGIKLIGRTAVFTLRQQMFGNGVIEIIPTKGRIAAGCLNLENALLHFQKRDIKGAAAKIVNGVKPLCPVIKAIGKGCCGRLIDQTQHFDASKLGRILGRGTRAIIEIGRDRNHRLFDRLIQAFFGTGAQGTQNIGRDFNRG